jgi:Kef-type K+ transport system membrane component KefB
MTTHLLLGFALLLVTAAGTGAIFRRASQPAIIGEILAGVLLGPTFLGALPGSPTAAVFDVGTLKAVGALGQIGVVLYVFTLGLHLDLGMVRKRGRLIAAVSLSSAAVPFTLALPIGFVLYQMHLGPVARGINELSFVLFIGLAFSVTAVPVLARVIADRGLNRLQLAQAALASAVVQDLFSWLALAAILGLARGHGRRALVLTVLVVSVGAAATLLVGAVLRLHQARQPYSDRGTETGESSFGIVLMLAGAALAAAATSAVGLQPILGAVVCGIVFGQLLPAERVKARMTNLQPILQSVLLPCYFLAPGLAVNFRTLTAANVVTIGFIVIVASLCKIGSASLASRLCGLTWKQAGLMGVLMNARGLVELVLLRIGYEAGLVGTRLFSELIATAVITTALTGPLLMLLIPRRVVAPLSEYDLPARVELTRA